MPLTPLLVNRGSRVSPHSFRVIKYKPNVVPSPAKKLYTNLYTKNWKTYKTWST